MSLSTLANLANLASLASVVSGLAVLVSLVYLSLQVRQTERNQRALMNQGAVTQIANSLSWLTEPVVADLAARVEAGDTAFTARELQQLRGRMRSMLLAAQDSYVQHKAKLVDEITWLNASAVVRYVMAQAGYRALWRATRVTYAPEWVAYVDRLIEETPLATPVDAVARFRADLAEVLGAGKSAPGVQGEGP